MGMERRTIVFEAAGDLEVRPEVEGAARRHRCVDAATRGVEDGKVSKGGPRGKMGRKVRRERRGL